MLEYLLALIVVHSLAIAPHTLAEPLARVYTRLLDLTIPRLRRVGMRNLEIALPGLNAKERTRIVNGVFRSIARMLVTFARFPRMTRDNIHGWIRYEGYEHFERALEQGKGVLFATAHLGNWELSAFAHALMSEPMNVVVRPLDNPNLDELVAHRRTLSGHKLLSKRDFARSLLYALRANEPVGVLVDQNS